MTHSMTDGELEQIRDVIRILGRRLSYSDAMIELEDRDRRELFYLVESIEKWLR